MGSVKRQEAASRLLNSTLGKVDKQISSVDKLYGKTKSYQKGQGAARKSSGLIDSLVDIFFQ